MHLAVLSQVLTFFLSTSTYCAVAFVRLLSQRLLNMPPSMLPCAVQTRAMRDSHSIQSWVYLECLTLESVRALGMGILAMGLAASLSGYKYLHGIAEHIPN